MAVAGVALKVVNTGLNAVLAPLVRSPLHRLVSSRIALITYTGRRSGKTFSTPVADRRGDEVRIDVAMPDTSTGGGTSTATAARSRSRSPASPTTATPSRLVTTRAASG